PEVPYLKLPRVAALFQGRAARLHQLAERHAAADWVRALATLCEAQHDAASGPGQALQVLEFGSVTPLADVDPASDPAWRRALAIILDRMAVAVLPEAGRAAVLRLKEASDEALGSWAASLVGGGGGGSDGGGDRTGAGVPPDTAAAAFLGASLQVHFA